MAARGRGGAGGVLGGVAGRRRARQNAGPGTARLTPRAAPPDAPRRRRRGARAGRSARRRASTRSRSSQLERSGGWVATISSSAGNATSASSIACSGSASPTRPVGGDGVFAQPADAARESQLGGVACAVGVREPVAQAAVERRRDDEHLGAGVAGRGEDRLVEDDALGRLVGDDQHAAGRVVSEHGADPSRRACEQPEQGLKSG